MKIQDVLYQTVAMIMITTLLSGSAFAQNKNLVIRIAKLEIDAAKLESCKNKRTEKMETSVHVEPGILSLCAVSNKANPAASLYLRYMLLTMLTIPIYKHPI